MVNSSEWAALIEEYKNLTDEIKRRVSYQLIIIGGNITFITAVINALSDKFDTNHLTIILLLPLVSFVIVWLFYEQDVFVTQPARYLHRKLRPAMLDVIESDSNPPKDSSKVMNWEEYRNELLFSAGSDYKNFMWFMIFFRTAATAGPGIALVVGALYLTWDLSFCNNLTLLQMLLFIVDIVGIGFCFYTHHRVNAYYKGIPGS